MIIISPWAKELINKQLNPKSPTLKWWKQVVRAIEEPIVQIGIKGEHRLVNDFRANLSIDSLCSLLAECRTFITIDSFFQHLAWEQNKPGIVIWGQSDPNIFGHDIHVNLLKDRSYLLKEQFLMWEMVKYRTDCFVDPAEVIKCL